MKIKDIFLLENKKAKSTLLTYLTGTLITAIIAFIFLTAFGLGGGFVTAFNLGRFVSQIPVWAWAILGVWVLITWVRD